MSSPLEDLAFDFTEDVIWCSERIAEIKRHIDSGELDEGYGRTLELRDARLGLNSLEECLRDYQKKFRLLMQADVPTTETIILTPAKAPSVDVDAPVDLPVDVR
jgi:hypothetical protein